MSTALVSNGIKPAEPSAIYDAAYEKILRLRDDVFADKHPKIKLPKPIPAVSQPSSQSLAAPTVARAGSNIAPKAPTQNGVSYISNSQASVASPREHGPPPTSSIDPISLTKPDVLVRAEIQQQRQRLERSLDEQLIHKRAVARQNVWEEYALPDFSVDEVLRRAHATVKPVRWSDRNTANRPGSSSDSFDENTFYSSQMNTTSEETDASAHRTAQADARAQDEGTQPMDIDSSNEADEQANSRPQNSAEPVLTKVHESPEEQIARLEAELRLLKSAEKATQRHVTPPASRAEEADEPPYSPPDVRAPPSPAPRVNNVSIADTSRDRPQEPATRRSSRALESQSREYARRDNNIQFPEASDMRIVRNHITSPLAPQPARVSPLAVAKGPTVPQTRNNPHQNKARGLNATNGAGRHSPNQGVQPLTSRKRRRRTNSGEKARNVAARREASPEIRIKEEPLSPQPGALGAWRPPRTEEVERPMYIDSSTPRSAQPNVSIFRQDAIIIRALSTCLIKQDH